MSPGHPYLSVVICTYNRDGYIGASLLCLARQSLDPNFFEIIVVDNNSTDNTEAIVRDFIGRHPWLQARYVFEERKGLSFARNRGMKEARGEVITYIDDDAEAVPGYLDKIYQFAQAHPEVAGIGGRVIPKYQNGSEPAWMSKYLSGFVGRVDYGTEITEYNSQMKYPAGCNMTYRKAILEEAGGFNNQLTFRSDDKFIFFKVREVNPRVYYLPGALVYHNIDDNRLRFDNFRKLFLKTGNEEKVRLRSEGSATGLISKFFELGFKVGASLLLYVLFLLKGQEIKGRYLVYAQWFTFVGFMRKSVFVR
jgi:glucosyl-dolichyl phosphate glucuronosyltransferase